ncbi:MAG: P-loop domain-containing protein [Brevinema sp.]
MHNLKSKLMRLNKCKYHLYNSLLGSYQFDDFSLNIDQIQPDPFAPPSKATIIVPLKNTRFSKKLLSSPTREYAFCDAIGRIFAKNIRTFIKEDKGSGNGGMCVIRYGMQKVMESNAVIINDDAIEMKVLLGMPGYGRSIAGKEAQEFLLEEIPALVRASLIKTQEHEEYLEEFVTVVERQHWLREECKQKGLISFIANGSILARASSINDKPMSHQKAVAFESPKEFLTTITLPDGFKLHGMGIPKGITLIAGGGFHGKSTLLSALSHTIYNHIPGDGREYCVTDESAVFLRSEEGRSVMGVDISPFIHHLPDYKSSVYFETENASGSSSQAANLVESLEMGSKLLLIDEDVSATNFLIRDARMRSLIPDSKETITPLIAHMKNLKEQGISLVMVTGALGDFMSIADRVIVAENYHYHDVTDQAKKIIAESPVTPILAKKFDFKSKRIISNTSADFLGKKGKAIIDGEKNLVKIGREVIDLRDWEHLYDYSQFATLAAVIAYAKKQNYFGQQPEQVWEAVQRDIDKMGWDILSDVGFDHFSPREEKRKYKQNQDKLDNTKNWRYIVKTRPLDWHAALSRMRGLSYERMGVDK